MPTLPQVPLNKLDNLGSVRDVKVSEGSIIDDDRRSAKGSVIGSVISSRWGAKKASDLQSVLSSSHGGGDSDARSVRSIGKTTVKTSQSVINLRKKAHLRAALISKLLDKYHPGIANSKTEKLIVAEIDHLLTVGVVSEDDLRETEARVRKQSNQDIAAIATNPFKRIPRHKCGEEDDWAHMNQKKLSEAKQFDARKAEAKRVEKAEFRRQLAAQVQAVEDRKHALLDEKKRDAVQVKREVQDYLHERERIRHEQAENFRKIREERQIEMDLVKQKKEKVKAEKKKEERELMAQLRESQKEEMLKLKLKKNEDMQRAQLWKEDNEKHLKEKDRQKEMQKQKDWELQKNAMRIAEEQEARRLKDLEELKKKMQAREAQYAEYGASLARQAKEDEERMIRVQKEAKEKADKEHEAKLEQEKQKKIMIRECLDAQVHDEEVRKSQEKKRLEEQSKLWRKQAMDAVVEAHKKEEAKRLAVEEYRIQLEDQLRADVKQRPGRELKMSDQERRINRDSLD